MFGGPGDLPDGMPDELKKALKQKLEEHKQVNYDTDDLPVDTEIRDNLVVRGFHLRDELQDIEIGGTGKSIDTGVKPVNESQPFELLRLMFVMTVDDVTITKDSLKDIRDAENFNRDTDLLRIEKGDLILLLHSDSYEPDEDEKPSEEEIERMTGLPDGVEVEMMGGPL